MNNLNTNNNNTNKGNKGNKGNNKFVNKSKLNFVVDIGDKKILQVGCGGVGSSMPFLYKKHLKYSPGNIVIVDKDPKKIEPFVKKYPTIQFVQQEVTTKNYKDIFNKYLTKGDVFVDLAWYISTPDMLKLCHEKGVFFVNTAIESWYGEEDCDLKTKECETLYRHQHALRKLSKDWGNQGATAIVAHGMNPGAISHCMKLGIRDWVNYLYKKDPSDKDVKKAKEYLSEGMYNEAARKLNIQVIHIAERDTQISKNPKQVGEFCCTWSPTGLE